MSAPHLTVILPSRLRIAWLSRFLTSVQQTALRPDDLDILLRCDEDDEQTCSFAWPGLPLTKHIGPRQTMGQVTNDCASRAKGQLLLFMNDDVVIRTPGWDEALRSVFEAYPDRIALVYGNDLDKGKAMATFPAVSRQVMQRLGALCPDDLPGNYIDVHLFDIFRKLQRLGHDRTIYLPDLVFEHLHFKAGKAPWDQTYARKADKEGELILIASEDERRYKARILAHAIENRK